MSSPTYEFQLEFLDFLQRLLDEGEFTATYKFALLMAIADISVEKGEDSAVSLEITAQEIAAKFIKYYQRQALPFVGLGSSSETAILHQNTGRQARVVSLVREAQENYEHGNSDGIDLSLRRPGLLGKVTATVVERPLWKLQVLRGGENNFFYPNMKPSRTIQLNPGIAFCFRRFHGFVHRLAQAGWVRFLRNRPQNHVLLGEVGDLGAFLFGSERNPLGSYRDFLKEIQANQCFYCGSRMGSPQVDHFIPWSRYSFDLGHNFVLACPSCNSSKRDMLAAPRHLENWVRRNGDRQLEMEEFFRCRNLNHDLDGSTMVAKWAYGQAANSKALVWLCAKEISRLPYDWANCFLA